ncbi:hypothetical protein BOH78_4865 [Pichia kudriavzevii]|uniref:Uncharacterized protein n=2 Tax=Pichia kudriavzevii TaxID=4909 RepID=A0A1V2LF00_PICKU|nr:hypothetical protein BOH78_5183 [Pichia kudriavzevii]ONH70948.1 hypothetical protein BOH78_4865 [Pichia kudriavzevii]
MRVSSPREEVELYRDTLEKENCYNGNNPTTSPYVLRPIHPLLLIRLAVANTPPTRTSSHHVELDNCC